MTNSGLVFWQFCQKTRHKRKKAPADRGKKCRRGLVLTFSACEALTQSRSSPLVAMTFLYQ